jgi:hypothetical protein
LAIEVGNHAASFDCQLCQQRHCDESGEIEGSVGPAAYPRWSIPGVLEDSRTCPKPKVTQQSVALLRLFKHYRHGLLPLNGGLMDQPAAYIEAMEIIEGYG